MTEFTEYQRHMWLWLSYVTVCSHVIEKDKNGKYVIRRAGPIRTLLYYLIWTNSLIKVTYLILTYQGFLLEVHFLDQMSMWDWFLCFFELLQESFMWYPKYPLYEVFTANWRVQEEIFRKLGQPQDVKRKILNNDRILVYMHTTIVIIGCCALMIQFFTAPKYALNTYAIIPYDNWILRILFAAHEFYFMWHIWVHAASSVVVGQVFAVTYTHIVDRMGDVLRQLSKHGPIDIPIEDDEEQVKNPHESRRCITSGSSHHEVHKKSLKFCPDRRLHFGTIIPGTEYSIMRILEDYKKIMLAAKEYNGWAGRLVGGITGTLYLQFVSDVFMMIQLLKEPDVDFMGVFFFFEDAFVGMFMMFRMLILMSRLWPKSEVFIQEFRNYMQNRVDNRRYLRREELTIRRVAAKLGGHSTNPKTVPKGINVLFNYYIAAAMWQRPQDRLT